MGRDKAQVEIGGVSMLDRIANTLWEQVDDVVVVGGDRPGALQDPPGIAGPLAGLAAGLAAFDGADAAFLTAVDHPFLRGETIRRLLNRFERKNAVIPVDEAGVRQVLCAVYPPMWAEQAEFEGAEGGSIQSLVDRLGFTPIEPTEWHSWEEDGRSWFSVDSPTKLEEGVRRYGAT